MNRTLCRSLLALSALALVAAGFQHPQALTP